MQPSRFCFSFLPLLVLDIYSKFSLCPPNCGLKEFLLLLWPWKRYSQWGLGPRHSTSVQQTEKNTQWFLSLNGNFYYSPLISHLSHPEEFCPDAHTHRHRAHVALSSDRCVTPPLNALTDASCISTRCKKHLSLQFPAPFVLNHSNKNKCINAP